jgi:hypothetical protein
MAKDAYRDRVVDTLRITGPDIASVHCIASMVEGLQE